MEPLEALSPLDGRYGSVGEALSPFFSEKAYLRYRLKIEVEWLKCLAGHPEIDLLGPFSDDETAKLDAIAEGFDLEDAKRIKACESRIGHDVKAVEYFLREELTRNGLGRCVECVHFLCTSEDVNNLAYGLMLLESRESLLVPSCEALLRALALISRDTLDVAMMARTHGQPATPTTFGKEIFVFVARLLEALEAVRSVAVKGKINGATGNFNAHVVAYPNVDWPSVSKRFVEKLGLRWNPFTTQTEPHDGIAELCQAWIRWNCVLIDLDRDLWGYVALGDLKQKLRSREVGSSTMTHKINPIHFENSEANAGMASTILDHLSRKLPVSRWQRDLSDSSAMRNLGMGLGYSLLANRSCLNGLERVEPDGEKTRRDLENAWELLGEAVQTVMRKHGLENPYETLRQATQGKKTTRESIKTLIEERDLPAEEKRRLLELRPQTYLGWAASLDKFEDYRKILERLGLEPLRKE